MPNYTKNYNLEKPLQEEFYNVDIFNANADIIDAELKKRASLDESGKVITEELPIGTANGVAGLDANGKVATGNLPIGTANGVAGLDETGKLPASAIPSGVGGGSGKRTSRYTVGSSSYGWTESDCDYLCDGTADEVEINAAIQALRSTGGEVVLLDGQYNLAGAIIVDKDNVTLTGNGANTKLIRGFTSTSDIPAMIFVNADYCTIRNLYLDGMNGNYTDSNQNGICTGSSVQYAMIEGNTIISCAGAGVRIQYNNNNVIKNLFRFDEYAIRVYNGSKNTVIGNTCRMGNYGIQLAAADGNAVVGNLIAENDMIAIVLSSSSNNTVCGNVCDENYRGIGLTSATDNAINGNTCNNNSEYGIHIGASCTNNTIAGNTCISNTSGDIYISDANNILYSKEGHTHAASAITAGTFAGQVVANSGGQAAGTYLVRNQKLSASEETPTVNGAICWLYE